jgi:hypothetical protein
MTTHDTLIQAAATLLDDGGEQAVTLVAAVAAADLEALTTNFAGIRGSAMQTLLTLLYRPCRTP